MSEARAAEVVASAADRYGAQRLDPPVLQPAGVYLELLGEELRSRAYLLAPETSGEELCLRPDMTVPICRMTAAMTGLDPKGFAASYDGLVFRRAPPGSARETEFRQVGVEVFGPPAHVAALEPLLLADAIRAVRALGVDPVVRLGDVGLFSAFVGKLGFSPGWTARLRRAFSVQGGLAAALAAAERDPPPPDPLAEAVADLGPEAGTQLVERLLAQQSGALVGRDAAAIARRLAAKGAAAAEDRPSPEAIAALRAFVAIEDDLEPALRAAEALGADAAPLRAWWAAALAAVDGAAPRARFSPGFGRGLAYYTGRLFELEAPSLRERASLGGGGRYDGLLSGLSTTAPQTGWTAAGFALRPRRLMEAGR